MKALFVGAGNSLERQIDPADFDGEKVSLDISGDPDVKHDLNVLPYPFVEEFDEIHAYEVLEHVGVQGDEFFFFAQFNEFYRILKPGGFLCGSVPSVESVWAWGDPGHTRVLPIQVFSYLTEGHYDQVGKTSAADYRHLIKGFWQINLWEHEEKLYFVLQK